MLSAALTPDQHQVFTNAWRSRFAYGKTDYANLSPNDIWNAAQRIYADYSQSVDRNGVSNVGILDTAVLIEIMRSAGARHGIQGLGKGSIYYPVPSTTSH